MYNLPSLRMQFSWKIPSNLLYILFQTRLPVNDPEFVMHWTFPCASYRHAIQISKFGLFFFIVNVKKEAQKTIADAWVQCVCPNGDARKYTFHVGLRMGNQIATFTDYVSVI